MKLKTLFVVVGVVLVLFGLGAWLVLASTQRKAEAALSSANAQIRAAGLPADAGDFRRLLGQPQGDNAFDALQTLVKEHNERVKGGKRSALSLSTEDFKDSETRIEFAYYMAALDDAAACDSYLAVREWEQGLVTLFPDFSHTKRAAQVHLARAELALERGDLDEVLTAAEKMTKVAAFLRSERHLIAVLVGDAIDLFAYRLIFRASPRFKREHWLRAQDVIDGVLPVLDARQALVGDMVMFIETVDDVCEGGPFAKDLMEAAQTGDGPIVRKKISVKSSYVIRTEARTIWLDVMNSAKSLRDYTVSDKKYERLFERIVAWSLFDGFPIEVAKIIEPLDSDHGPFKDLYDRAVRGEMVRMTFALARSGELPADGTVLNGTPELSAKFVFQLTTNGFSLSRADDPEMVVHYPG